MSKKTITQILSGIEPALVEECAFYRPPSERNGMKKNKTRRAAVLILAACLAAALGVTAYATGALQSLISKYWGGIVYQTPDEQLREERPDYAQWLDEQRQTQSMMQRIGEEAVQTEETYSIPGLPGAGVTLLEYYYDGEKLSLACQFKSPEEPVDFSAQGMDGLLFPACGGGQLALLWEHPQKSPGNPIRSGEAGSRGLPVLPGPGCLARRSRLWQ